MRNVKHSVQWKSTEHYGGISEILTGTCFEHITVWVKDEENHSKGRKQRKWGGDRAVGAKKIGHIWGI